MYCITFGFNYILETIYKIFPNIAPRYYYSVKKDSEGKDYVIEHKVNILQRLVFGNIPNEDPKQLFRLSLQKNGIPNDYREGVRACLKKTSTRQREISWIDVMKPIDLYFQNEEEKSIQAQIYACTYRDMGHCLSIDIAYNLFYANQKTEYPQFLGQDKLTFRWMDGIAYPAEEKISVYLRIYTLLKQQGYLPGQPEVDQFKAKLYLIKYIRDSTLSDQPNLHFNIYVRNYSEETTAEVKVLSKIPNVDCNITVPKHLFREAQSIFGTIDHSLCQKSNSFSLAFGLKHDSAAPNLASLTKSARKI